MTDNICPKCWCRDLANMADGGLRCVNCKHVIEEPTPTKPDELPEWALREAVEMLNAESPTGGWSMEGNRHHHCVRTVARLLVERGPKVDPFPAGTEVTYFNEGMSLRATVAGYVEGWIELRLSDGSTCVVRPSHVGPKVDPDLVLANCLANEIHISPTKARAAIKHLRSEGLLKEVG